MPRYILEVGERKDGSWWGRLDGTTWYSHGDGKDAHAAAIMAVEEAMFRMDDENMPTQPVSRHIR